MSLDLAPFLDTVRKAARSGIWSLGVKLARDEVVRLESVRGAELVLRVRAPGTPVPPTVTLYVEDGEWSCDCGGEMDPCAHVTASAIAAARLLETFGATPAEGAAPSRLPAREHLRYRLTKKAGQLVVERAIVTEPHEGAPETERPLGTGTLATLSARGALGELSPTHEDLALDRLLVASQRNVVLPHRVAEAFASLASATDVLLDGGKVTVSGEPVLPRAVVDATRTGFSLRIEKDPDVTEVVVPFVARCGDVLRPLGETSLTGDRLERLPLERAFTRAQAGELVAEAIPELSKRIPVLVRTRRLPRTSDRMRPRLAFDLTHDAHAMSVLPLLVYGDPPAARVDAGKLIHLGGPIPVRDEAAEKLLILRLRDQLNLVPGRRVDFDGDDAARFAVRLRAFTPTIDAETGESLVYDDALVPRLSLIGDGDFELAFETSADESDGTPRRASAAAVMRAFRAGMELVPLDGGGWAPLPADFLQKHGRAILDLLAAKEERGALPRAALPDLGALCAALDHPPPPALASLRPLLEGFDTLPEPALPDGFTASLRPYQRAGVAWLLFLRTAGLGAVLADDMGLGKTVQTIAALRGRSLVVCPKSVLFNWADELAKFRAGLRVSVFHGPKRALDPAADVTLCTYATLLRDGARLAKETWDTLVLDEAQTIKNPDSQTARAAYALPAAFRVALSGTPVENRLDELWSVVHFTNPGLLGGRSAFAERFAGPMERGDVRARDELRARVKPVLLRRTKREVTPELPPRTDTVLHVELEESERAIYDTVRAAARKDVLERLAEGGSVLAALEALLRLRQAACHPGLVPGQHAETSSKIEALVEALEDAAGDGHKALVFSQWTSLLDRVEPHLQTAGIAFTRLDGSTRDRGAVVADFQSPSGPPVLLVSLKAGGTGLNLTAADHVFLLDPWWNPAVEDQAADRAHRIGQDKPVFVYRLVAKDTVEEGILALAARKRALADAALGDGGAAGGITREDLLALLG